MNSRMLGAYGEDDGERDTGKGLWESDVGRDWEKGCREGTVGKGMQGGTVGKGMQGGDCGERDAGSGLWEKGCRKGLWEKKKDTGMGFS